MTWRTSRMAAIAIFALQAAACAPATDVDPITEAPGAELGTVTDTLGAELGLPEESVSDTVPAEPTISVRPPLSGKLEEVEPGGPMVAVELKDAFKPMPAKPEGSAPIAAEDQPALEDFFVKVADVEAGIRAGMDIVWLDARGKENFDFGHIPGAISAPYFEISDHVADVPRDRWVVTYCECPHHESGEAAMGLWNEGFTYVKVLEEGLGGWRDGLKMPVEPTE